MKILTIGLDPIHIKNWAEFPNDTDVQNIKSVDEFSDKCLNLIDGDFQLIIVGENLGADFVIEAGQVCKNQCPRTKIFGVLEKKEAFSPKTILKNGFNDVFLLPIDRDRLKGQLIEVIALSKNSKVFKRVKAFDVQPETDLPFDTFLHLQANNKYIKYSKANSKMEKSKVEKLNLFNVNNLYIDAKDSNEFYEYAACALLNTNEANFMSATEKEEKMGAMIQQIFSEVYTNDSENDFEVGKEILNSCQKILSNYISNGHDSNFFTKLIKSVNGLSDDYSHAAEVSTLAGYFALALGIDKIEDISIAAFFHDLGMIDCPDVDPMSPQTITDPEILKKYKTHPERSLHYIKSKRIILSEKAQKAISHHHERADGKGFPKGLNSERIPIESQIISLADQFQYLTRKIDGQPKVTAQEAIDTILKNGSIRQDIIIKIKKMATSN